MKIIVNTNAIEERLLKAANEVIEIAKEKAANGIGSFTISKIEGVDSWQLISKVNKLTEGTVDCAYRGLGSGCIRFCIKS